ncbi:hypothetical protein EDD11_007344 [Mortierella claussenii]|nr:hypothetical protein EDD11_007344 [Mortierella claussenii]
MAKGFDRYLADASVVAADDAATSDAQVEKKEKNATDDTKYHEAGYDAYITGQAFLRFAGYIIKERENAAIGEGGEHARKKRKLEDVDADGESTITSTPVDTATESTSTGTTPAVADAQADDEEEDGEVAETETEKDAFLEKQRRAIIGNPTSDILETDELKGYYNLLHMMRSDIPVMNLAGPDPEPEEKPHNYLLKNIPTAFQTSTLFHLFGSFNPFRFTWVDGNSAWIQLSLFAPAREGEESTREAYVPPSVPLGRLGEDYVNPYCVGSEPMAEKGRAAGVVPEAADIEIVSWRAWYDEREALERQNREQERQQQQQFNTRESNGRGPMRFNRGIGPSTSQAFAPSGSPRVMDGRSVESAPPEVVNGAATTLGGVNARSLTAVEDVAAVAGSKRKHTADEVDDRQS